MKEAADRNVKSLQRKAYRYTHTYHTVRNFEEDNCMWLDKDLENSSRRILVGPLLDMHWFGPFRIGKKKKNTDPSARALLY